VSAPLNLARRPFRNERLPTLLLGLGCLALVAVTVRHALAARDLLPGRTRQVEAELVELETELDSLRGEAAELRRLTAPREAVQEWTVVKGLVDRRAFSWTGLFEALEKALPPGVRLVSVAPQDAPRGMELSLSAAARTAEDALALFKSLQQSQDFDGVLPEKVGESREGVEVSCTVRYAPRAPRGAARGAQP
jgi:Tfp pilus assembly protein PilN